MLFPAVPLSSTDDYLGDARQNAKGTLRGMPDPLIYTALGACDGNHLPECLPGPVIESTRNLRNGLWSLEREPYSRTQGCGRTCQLVIELVPVP
jgi:hypothetical protein